ncbi:hypothetical protein CL619_00315 [archaeon]|nr:hypothetical protein [archaeon]|tara:strand:+ start:4150 stop:5595 length:1446 start_codon:yes stop_codon:yes gene_type:complete
MSENSLLSNGFVHKYGGTSVLTPEQDLSIVSRTIQRRRDVSDSGYSILVTSGTGKINDTPNGRKATDLMYEIVNGVRVDHNWEIVKDKFLAKLAAHQIPDFAWQEDIKRTERILVSGDTISEQDKPRLIGLPELMQAKTLFYLGQKVDPDHEWVLLSWPEGNIPLGMIGEQGHGFIDVPIDHQATLANILDIAQKSGIAGKIAVVPGFIGSYSTNQRGKLVTLERGSSDATATYWGAALGLDEVVIYSDKPGIFPIDPAVVSGLKTLRELTYLEAHLYAGWGAGIIQQLALRPAMDKKTLLRIKSSLKPQLPGTKIGGRPYTENFGVKAIAYVPGLSSVIVNDITDRPGSGGAVGVMFGKHGISVDHLIDGTNRRAHIVRLNENHHALISDLYESGHRVQTEGPLARVALVGAGMDLAQRLRADGDHATCVLTRTLREIGVPTYARTHFQGDISHSVFVEQQYGSTLVKTLARNLGIINGK